VLDLTPAEVQTEALEQTPVQEVWGVGQAYAKLLQGGGANDGAQAPRRGPQVDHATHDGRRGAHRRETTRGQLPAP
jgi:hypothetical protein